jgi:hypothetical protein
MEDFFFAGGVGAVLRELKPAAASRLPDRDRRDAGDRLEREGGFVDRAVIAPRRSKPRWNRRAGWWRCSATSRRAARS